MILNLAKECREENYENLGQRYLSMLRQLNMSKDIKVCVIEGVSEESSKDIVWLIMKLISSDQYDAGKCSAVMGSRPPWINKAAD